jgi:hypothetical protein
MGHASLSSAYIGVKTKAGKPMGRDMSEAMLILLIILFSFVIITIRLKRRTKKNKK